MEFHWLLEVLVERWAGVQAWAAAACGSSLQVATLSPVTACMSTDMSLLAKEIQVEGQTTQKHPWAHPTGHRSSTNCIEHDSD
jgi:hypothetical protein